jgi:Zn-dependent protease with chaperone function
MWAAYERAMTTSGQGSYFDGVTSARHDVTVELAAAAVQIRAVDGALLAQWPYGELDSLSAPANVLRIGRRDDPVLARLEILDPQLAAAIDQRSVPIDRSGRAERRSRAKVVAWSLAAIVSLVLVAAFGVPQIADRLAPLVPERLERRVGEAFNTQIRNALDTRHRGADFECGAEGSPGRAAFDKLLAPLERTAGLYSPLRVFVVHRSDANAITLPGGYIYVFEGLVTNSETPDELAGVLAHEIGHVAHRDITRSLLQGAGLSFLFGMLVGDYVGGGAMVIAARVLLRSSYARDVEAAADAYSVELMDKIGGNARALGTILTRIDGSTHAGLKLLLDHPVTTDRIVRINAAAGPAPARALLSDVDWAALKAICAGP